MPDPDDAAEALFEKLIAEQQGRRLPPVDQWRPAQVGRIDIRIARDGSWHHEGDPIRREAMVTLFSTILRREGDQHFLVTPVEKLAIDVELCAFVATALEVSGEGGDQRLLLTTNVGDHVLVDASHPLAMRETSEGPVPVLHVRDGLEALVSRPVYYRLADLAADQDGRTGLHSCGTFFPLT